MTSPAPPERPLPETIGRYRVVRLLGQGAMGRVLLAHDPVLDRDVAVKLLRDDLGIPPEHRTALLNRMRHEARASARVGHPGIVALHDMGEDAELGLFLVFEYVIGTTLKERLTRGPLGPEAAAKLAREIGDALTTAHNLGVLHRDIKPENVILAKPTAKIADFGIARVPNSTLTRDGGLLGTPAYSAPEAIASGKFSALTDQFSMAATLYEAISMRRAFPGDDAVAVATRIANEQPPRLAEICRLDPRVDTVLARALSKNPTARFESCEAFGRALAEALELTPRSSQPTLPDDFTSGPRPSGGLPDDFTSGRRPSGGLPDDFTSGRRPSGGLPDNRHLEQTAKRATEETTGTRRTRIAIGGAAVCALVAAGALELASNLRAPSAPLSAEQSDGGPLLPETIPIGFLAERPNDHKSHRGDRGHNDGGLRDTRDASTRDGAARSVTAGADGTRDASTTSPSPSPSNVSGGGR